MLVALAGKPTLLVVAPADVDFTDAAAPRRACGRSCATAPRASTSRSARGTGVRTRSPTQVDLVNVQGKDFEHDNEVAYLERDLDTVVEVVL